MEECFTQNTTCCKCGLGIMIRTGCYPICTDCQERLVEAEGYILLKDAKLTTKILIEYLSSLPIDTTIKILSADTGDDPVSSFINPSIGNEEHFLYSEKEGTLYIGNDRYNTVEAV